MVAIMGMFFQDSLTGNGWDDWVLYTASLLRAFDNKRGVQNPVGSWDPMGFTEDMYADAFKRKRQTELKHGRVSMLAIMGYIAPKIAGKWPDNISNSLSIKLVDVPNGLAAISNVPPACWAHLLAYGA